MNPAPANMTFEAWETVQKLNYVGFTDEQDCSAWQTTPSGGALAVAIRILNPNTFPRCMSREEIHQLVEDSCTATIVTIAPDGVMTRFDEVLKGKAAYVYWDDREKQQMLLPQELNLTA